MQTSSHSNHPTGDPQAVGLGTDGAGVPTATRYELRVLTGSQRGARLALTPGGCSRVGSDWASDIVLRGLQAATGGAAEGVAVAADITPDDEGMQLTLRSGSATLGGLAIATGEPCRVEPGSLLCLGEVAVMLAPIGAPGADLASAVADIGGKSPASADPLPEPSLTTAPAARPLAGGARWGRRLVVGGAGVVAASLSMLALAIVTQPQGNAAVDVARRAEHLLHGAGFDSVTVDGENGSLLVQGHLQTRAARQKVEQLLAEQGLSPRLALWVDENLQQSIQDVYRVHGVVAEVQGEGPGRFKVRTQLSDPTALAAIERAVRRDVQGLVQLQTANAAPQLPASPIPVLDDPGKRVASVVAQTSAGAEPYVVTQDGTRYFAGALLPTGHRIVAIADGRIELEREGQHSALAF